MAMKGEEIWCGKSICAQETLRIERRCLRCSKCGREAGNLSQQLSIALGQARVSVCQKPRWSLPKLGGKEVDEACSCERAGCDEVYCSRQCRQEDQALHRIVCGGRGGNEYSTDLRKFAKSSGMEHLLLLARLVGLMLDHKSTSNHNAKESLNEAYRDHAIHKLLAVCDGVLDVRLAGSHCEDPTGFDQDCTDEESEAWVLFSSLIGAEIDYRNQERAMDSDCDDLDWVRQYLMEKHSFLKLLRFVKQLMVSIFVPSPLISYCQDLIRQDVHDRVRQEAASALSSFIEDVMSNDGKEGSDHRTVNPCEAESKDSDRVLRERKLARLAQGALEKSSTSNPFGASFNIVHAIIPGLCGCVHSCVPNTLLEALYDDAGNSFVRAVALRNIQE
eukprot:768617-Hanusia_phi.AAC.1